MTKRVRVEWLQCHVRNARGILFLLNKLHVKKESFSCSFPGSPIPDGDTFSPQIFCRCFLLSFECQFLEEDGNKGGFFPGSAKTRALQIEGPIHQLLVKSCSGQLCFACTLFHPPWWVGNHVSSLV